MFGQENYRPELQGGRIELSPVFQKRLDGMYVSHVASPYNWEQVLRVLRKNLKFVVVLALLASGLVALLAFRMKDKYQPVAKLEIDPPGSEALSPREAEASFEYYQEYLETQLQILLSDELAMRVVRALHLDRNPEVVGKKMLARYGVKPLASSAVTSCNTLSSSEGHESADPNERTPLETVALRSVHDNLGVGMVRGSRLLELSYGSHDPRLATQVTNCLVTQFIDRNFKTRYQSTMEASDWLSMQLNDLQRKVEHSNQAVVDYQKRYGLIEEDEKDGPTFRLVSDASHQLSEAQAERIQTEAFVRMISVGQTQSLPQVQSSETYQTITSQYAETSAKLAEARAVYGEANTNYKKLENQVNELSRQRGAEEERIVNRVYTSYLAAQERERLMSGKVNQLKAQMGNLNERMVRYQVLKNDAHANSELYNALLARLKEAGLYAGLKSSNIRVVDSAVLLTKPSGPHRPLIIAVGTILSGLFAVVLAFAKESLNNTIRTPDDAREWANLPSLAIVPLVSPLNVGDKQKSLPGQVGTILGRALPEKHIKGQPLIFATAEDSLGAESLRDLRTSLLLSRTDGQGPYPRVVLVASSAAEEGKSTIAINLALSLSKRAKTCLMDADLRGPQVATAFGKSPEIGWDDALAGSRNIDETFIRVDGYPNLTLLPVGENHGNHVELITTGRIKELLDSLRECFEFVVVDSPPVISFSDARILAPLTDAIVVVSRWGLTTRRALLRCVERLQEVGGTVTGLVVNAMDYSSPDYQYYNFGYSSGNLNGYGRYRYTETRKGDSDDRPGPKVKAASA